MEAREIALDTAPGTFWENIDYRKEGTLKHGEYKKFLYCWLQSYRGKEKQTNSDEYAGKTQVGIGLWHRECVGHIGLKTRFINSVSHWTNSTGHCAGLEHV